MAVPTLGKKGTWLCHKNLKYEKLSSKVEEDIWSFGTPSQRYKYLEVLLRDYPLQAHKLLRENWNSEDLREKLKHLKLVLQNLDVKLLGFVEELYYGEFSYTKKESVTHRNCRNILAKYLLFYEQTELYKTTKKDLSKYRVQKKRTLLSKVFQSQEALLNIPNEEDTFFSKLNMLKTYGINVQSTRAADFKTDQIYWFSELCEAIPFSFWSQLFEAKPKQILTEFLESEKYKIVVNNNKISCLEDSLVKLAGRVKNDEFTLLLLEKTSKKDIEILLISMLSPAIWETYLAKNKNLIDNKTLKDCPHIPGSLWSLSFSKILLSLITDQLNNKRYQSDYTIGLTIAERIHTDIEQYLIKLNNERNQNNQLYNYWKNYMFDPIYETISIKNKIHKL